MKERHKYVLVKKVAKHGSQAIIVIPRMLEDALKPGTVMQVTLEVLQEAPSSQVAEGEVKA